MTTMPVAFRVNGRPRTADVTPSTTLLEVLRERLLLTGAKRGCNQGVCGACTVMLDGRPVRGCLSLVVECDGHEVTTVEGLGPPNALNPVQQAIVDSGAVQCGFCTPGMVVSATALMRDRPGATVDEVRAGLSGHLCRCSGYRGLVEAVHRALGSVAE
jgi:aerobic carbon-monoxide dehydrogenase small subunit